MKRSDYEIVQYIQRLFVFLLSIVCHAQKTMFICCQAKQTSDPIKLFLFVSQRVNKLFQDVHISFAQVQAE